ncbi:hypothetical protein MPC1_12620003 [Methylocella tundrae]|nr:hypothetical protein MPC1_12620003 [Methylocella tundrae]
MEYYAGINVSLIQSQQVNLGRVICGIHSTTHDLARPSSGSPRRIA